MRYYTMESTLKCQGIPTKGERVRLPRGADLESSRWVDGQFINLLGYNPYTRAFFVEENDRADTWEAIQAAEKVMRFLAEHATSGQMIVWVEDDYGGVVMAYRITPGVMEKFTAKRIFIKDAEGEYLDSLAASLRSNVPDGLTVMVGYALP